MNGGGRTVWLGVVLAAVALVAVIVWLTFGAGSIPWLDEEPDSLVVIALGATPEGYDVARFVLRFDLDSPEVSWEAFDPRLDVDVPGTSVAVLGEAYPFVGAPGVTRAVAELSGSPGLPHAWILFEEGEWGAVIDDAGGFSITLAESVNVWDGLELVRLDAGQHLLDGREVEALAAAVEFEDEATRAEMRAMIEHAMVASITAGHVSLAESVRTGAAESSVGAATLERMTGRLRRP